MDTAQKKTEFLQREALPYRHVSFWREGDTFESYTNPLSGWWYRIRRVGEEDAYPTASGWVLEAWHYGEQMICDQVMTRHEWLRDASLGEMIACAAVFTAEQTSPRMLFEGSPSEKNRLRTRWRNWMKTQPQWVGDVSGQTE